jgi:superfamily I DNA/RNA helicase
VAPEPTVDRLLARLKEMFGKKGKAIELATVHGAKGLEWARVFILAPDKFPSNWDSGKREFMRSVRSAIDLEQERNIEYVAITRAKEELCFVWGDVAAGPDDDNEDYDDDDDETTTEEDEWL